MRKHRRAWSIGIAPLGSSTDTVAGTRAPSPRFRDITILAIGKGGTDTLELAGIPKTLLSGDADPGLILTTAEGINSGIDAFITALRQHRHFARETEPPRV